MTAGQHAQHAAALHPIPPELDAGRFTYSVVIPVYNSEAVVGDTVDQLVAVFEHMQLQYEVVLVNDGSVDNSWNIIAEKARNNPSITALQMLKNYGQHNANLAGLRETTGDWVLTMDDDLQNPPDQIPLMIEAALQGHDVIFGEFESKQASGVRRLGSKVIGMLNRRIFGQPHDLVVSNFRIMRRDVVDRICESRTSYPYITGQALLYSHSPANVRVRHDPRLVGRSSYSLFRIIRLVLTILFSYSVFPLRLAAAIGFIVALLSFVLGGYYLVSGWVRGHRVPGWTSLIVLAATLNGIIILLISMVGEYIVRTLNTVSHTHTYHVVDRVGR